MMILLGPILNVLAILIGLLLFAWAAVKFVRPREQLARTLWWVGIGVLVLFVILTAASWPRGGMDAPGFLPAPSATLYAILAWLAAPALVCVLLLGPKEIGWWPVVALLSWVLAIWAGIHQQGVADRLAVAAGRNGPPAGLVTAAQPLSHPGAYLFAPSFSSSNVSVYDLATDRRVALIGIQARGACCAYQTPDHKKVYIVDGLSPYVTAIDVASLRVQHVTKLRGTWGDRGTTIQRDGKIFWFSEIFQGHVEAIDTATNAIVHSYPEIGNNFTVTLDGKILASVAKDRSTLVIRQAATGRVLGSLELPKPGGRTIGAVALYASQDDTKVYVELLGDPGALVVVDVRDPGHPNIIQTVPLGAVPLVGAFRPEVHQFWIPNAGDGTISVIDTLTNKVVHVIRTGRYVAAVAFYGSKAYVMQSPSAQPPSYKTSLSETITGVILGTALAPTTGAAEWRPGIDPPGEIVVYDANSYQRLPSVPAMPLPSIAFNLEVVPVP